MSALDKLGGAILVIVTIVVFVQATADCFIRFPNGLGLWLAIGTAYSGGCIVLSVLRDRL